MELTNHRDTDYDMNVKILGVFLNWEPMAKSNPTNCGRIRTTSLVSTSSEAARFGSL
jgi:hypothetical protein